MVKQMELETLLNWLIKIGILGGVWLSIYFQRKKISELKTGIDAQKVVIEALKSYLDLFQIDELKKYVQLNKENSQMETEKKIKEIEEINANKISKLSKDSKYDVDFARNLSNVLV